MILMFSYKNTLNSPVNTKIMKVPTNTPNMNLIDFLKPILAEETDANILFGPGVKTDIRIYVINPGIISFPSTLN